jgi:Na+-transporting NADH:ubiquinone oxidoreductase subunit D
MPQARIGDLVAPLVNANPVMLHILGICSALAVTKTVATALIMSAAVTCVLVLSNTLISLIRKHLPRHVRLIIQITIIASLVIIVDQVLRAFAYELSRQLSVFVGLIVTNCIILGRAEAFAMQNGPRASALDGLGNGLGYSWVLLLVGAIRELLGAGKLLGVSVLPMETEGGWFEPMALMLLPPSAFFIIGFLIWGLRSWKSEQGETVEFPLQPVAREVEPQ